MTYIQQAIATIGDRGRYQKILMGYLIFCYIQLGLILFGSTFVFMNPQFDCPGLSENPSEEEACPVIQTCTISNPYTATAYANLYCDNSTERNIVQSAIYIGAIIGLLGLTPFADSKGKKRMFLVAIGLCIIGIFLDVVGVYARSAVPIVIGQIILGAGAYCILIIGYVILGELTEDKFKQIGIITLNAVWAIGEIMIGGLYFVYNQWDNYLVLFILIPMVGLLLFGMFFLVESPYYLIQKQKNMKKALSAMRQIAMINHASPGAMVEVESNFQLALKGIDEKLEGDSSEQASRFAIFKDFKYLKILLLVAVCEVAINMVYYGIQFSLGKIGTSFGSNILLMGIVEFWAFFSFNFIITKLPRKRGTMIFNIICLVLGLLFIFDLPNVVQTIILGFCRWFNAYAMGVVPMLQSEPFPHKYRSSVWGYIEGFSQIGNFLTPFIVTACDNANLPTLTVVGVLSGILGITPLFFIKETLNVSEDQLLKEEKIQERLEAGMSINKDDEGDGDSSLLT